MSESRKDFLKKLAVFPFTGVLFGSEETGPPALPLTSPEEPVRFLDEVQGLKSRRRDVMKGLMTERTVEKSPLLLEVDVTPGPAAYTMVVRVDATTENFEVQRDTGNGFFLRKTGSALKGSTFTDRVVRSRQMKVYRYRVWDADTGMFGSPIAVMINPIVEPRQQLRRERVNS